MSPVTVDPPEGSRSMSMSGEEDMEKSKRRDSKSGKRLAYKTALLDLFAATVVCAYFCLVMVLCLSHSHRTSGRRVDKTLLSLEGLLLVLFLVESLYKSVRSAAPKVLERWDLFDLGLIGLSLCLTGALLHFPSKQKMLIGPADAFRVVLLLRKWKLSGLVFRRLGDTVSVGLMSPLHRCLFLLKRAQNDMDSAEIAEVIALLSSGDLLEPGEVFDCGVSPGAHSFKQEATWWFKTGKRGKLYIPDREKASVYFQRKDLTTKHRRHLSTIDQVPTYTSFKIGDDTRSSGTGSGPERVVSKGSESSPEMAVEESPAEMLARASENIPAEALAGLHKTDSEGEGSLGRVLNIELSDSVEAELVTLLEKAETWEFDVFRLEETSAEHSLAALLNHITLRHSLLDDLQIPSDKWHRFVRRLERGYCAENAYHKALHAADVTQAAYFVCTEGGLSENMADFSVVDFFSVVLAAAAHDYDHPGVNNAFLMKTGDPLAIRYNDRSVLENHHISAVWSLLVREDASFLSHLPTETIAVIREILITIVLSTDMTLHFSKLGAFKAKSAASKSWIENPKMTNEDKMLLFSVAVHACDISNPARPLPAYRKWTELVMTEFFSQGDRERENGLPISMLMDRASTNIARGQVGFIDVIVVPLLTAMEEVLPAMKVCTTYMKGNRDFWAENEAAAEAQMKAGTQKVPVLPVFWQQYHLKHQMGAEDEDGTNQRQGGSDGARTTGSLRSRRSSLMSAANLLSLPSPTSKSAKRHSTLTCAPTASQILKRAESLRKGPRNRQVD
uniref:Phosphodiesterase n=1 Tax=Chromera velia CCMP2878 TaxID=1169474 RepID=A0A0G4F7T7_9ALVE|eukprot:Cvel_15676.t1-p1 / transcript=Cvel_15676.t1 / gene=Cvel_15676 / organism=Chromera_velia_CCMP2878 / gene_product=cAMP-specific 3',5'-cyclic phosphodiesterase 4C, putative / transcript_product=cAMP-specific 3',5'-cyclic phosphodiesterase 4C, putative / location=Cvel_scaffold1170:28170-33711(-) / protein_length=787 / sequence_SO=supercontig / SO=protein_coding / is_pseudo=false